MKRTYMIMLPSFGGLYNSIWFDSGNAEENYEMRGVTTFDEGWSFDKEGYFKALGASYTDCVDKLYHELYNGFRMAFLKIYSPREYNFSTDEIYASLEVYNVDEFRNGILELIDRHYEYLKKTIHDKHTSYSGFCSFMSNDIEEWKKTFMDDELVLQYLLYYILVAERKRCHISASVDEDIYDDIDVDEDSFWYPDSEDAKEEWNRILFEEEQKAWDREHQLLIPFPELATL